MHSLFRLVLRMSITASYVIVAVIIIRMLLKRFPKKYSYFLWSAVLFRLCCPFSLGSALSIFNFSLKREEAVLINLSEVPAAFDVETQTVVGRVELGMPSVTEAVRKFCYSSGISLKIPEPLSSGSSSVVQKVDLMTMLVIIWITGVVLLVSAALIRDLRMRRELEFSVPFRDNIRQADVRSPFLLGLIRPVIYVPFSEDTTSMELSIAHESYHLKRMDHWVRALSFCLLCVHWMNPLCWIAYFLMIRDMEMSCDEHVLSRDEDLRDAYSSALLSFATERKKAGPEPIWFGDSDLKVRIQNILRYKHTSRMMSAAAVVICVLMLVSCASNGTEVGIARASYVLKGSTLGSYAISGDTVTAGKFGAEESVPDESIMTWPFTRMLAARRNPDDSNTVDICSSSGMEVLATLGGTVDKVGFDEKTGFYVIIEHGGGISTAYSFLQSVDVQAGMKVEKMEVLGHIGSVRTPENNDVALFQLKVFLEGKEIDPKQFLEAFDSLTNTWD